MTEVGSIVQIDPASQNEAFRACLLIVTEVKSWGVQGYVKNAGQDGLAYVRVSNGDFVDTGGKAGWVSS